MIKWVRKYHKWLMALVGIQVLFWSITGMYMVSMDIHYIHGESLANQNKASLDVSKVRYSFNELVKHYPKAANIKLREHMGDPVYVFNNGDKGKFAISANTGEKLASVDEASAKDIAQYYYANNHELDNIRLISEVSDMPPELSSRHLPVWRVTFDNIATPTFYISQQTGMLVAKRHDYWRLFDWMWRFHIMDYDDGENVANWFLLLIATLSLLGALAGAVLTYHRVFSSKKEGAL